VRYADDDVPFVTRAADARLDFSLVTLPSGTQVTRLPLADGVAAPLPNGALLRASLVRVDAIEALAGFGLVLCTLEVLHEIASVGLWIPPVTLVVDAYDQAHMQSLGYKREHDRRCWEACEKRSVTPDNVDGLLVPVLNFGKTHKAAEEHGRPVPENGDNFLGGWDKADDRRPNFIQAGVGRNHRRQAKSLRDYGTNTYGMVPR
jgi:hypothetical protein